VWHYRLILRVHRKTASAWQLLNLSDWFKQNYPINRADMIRNGYIVGSIFGWGWSLSRVVAMVVVLRERIDGSLALSSI
jgi:hypothetical protein